MAIIGHITEFHIEETDEEMIKIVDRFKLVSVSLDPKTLLNFVVSPQEIKIFAECMTVVKEDKNGQETV